MTPYYYYSIVQVNKIAISPDKRYLAVAGNPAVRLYDVHSNSPDSVMSFGAHTGNVTAIAFQSNGITYECSEQVKLRVERVGKQRAKRVNR